MKTENKVKCKVCGYEWVYRKAKPKSCARCKRYDYDGVVKK